MPGHDHPNPPHPPYFPPPVTRYPYTASAHLPEEYEEFRATARAFVEREIRPSATAWEANGIVPRELYAKAGAAGFLGLRFDPRWGGSGMDHRATVVLCEELGGCDSIGTATALMAHAEFSLPLLAEHGSEPLQEQFLEPAVRGESIGAIAVTEPGTGSDVGTLTTRARREGDHLVVSGQKTFISNGTQADFVIVALRTGAQGPIGISLVLVPTDTPGFSVGRRLDKLGARASDTGELYFDDCRVPANHLIGRAGRGLAYLVPHFAVERLVLSAFATGAMGRLIELGLDYAQARRTFDKPLSAYQTWRHRFAEAATRLEASRQLTYHAAYLLDLRDPAAEATVAMAKLFSAGALQSVASEMLQIHGGFGQMEESPIPRYYRDAAGFSVGAGTSEIMRETIAHRLVDTSTSNQ